MRLDVGIAATEQLLGAINRGLLDNIDKLAAAVEAVAWIAFESLVGHLVAQRIENGAADDVLGSDQFDLVLLAPQFMRQRASNQRIGLVRVRREEGAGRIGHGNPS